MGWIASFFVGVFMALVGVLVAVNIVQSGACEMMIAEGQPMRVCPEPLYYVVPAAVGLVAGFSFGFVVCAVVWHLLAPRIRPRRGSLEAGR